MSFAFSDTRIGGKLILVVEVIHAYICYRLYITEGLIENKSSFPPQVFSDDRHHFPSKSSPQRLPVFFPFAPLLILEANPIKRFAQCRCSQYLIGSMSNALPSNWISHYRTIMPNYNLWFHKRFFINSLFHKIKKKMSFNRPRIKSVSNGVVFVPLLSN